MNGTEANLCPKATASNSSTSATASSEVVAAVFASWTMSTSSDDLLLVPDNDEFIDALLADDENDLITTPDYATSSSPGDYLPMHSPSSVSNFCIVRSNPKRQKLIDVESSGQSPFPLPAQRLSGEKPVCTFLNYLGTRTVELDHIKANAVGHVNTTDPIKNSVQSSLKTLVPKAYLLFPVCPCKLSRLCLGGDIACSLPILEVIASAANFNCSTSTQIKLLNTNNTGDVSDNVGGGDDDDDSCSADSIEAVLSNNVLTEKD